MPRSFAAAPKDHFFQRLRGTGAGLGSDQQIRLVLRYGGRLDLGLLQRAAGAVVEEEPILRARFVEPRPFAGRWELPEGDRAVLAPTCRVEEARDPEPAIAAYLAELDVRPDGPYWCLRVIRGAGRDALCLRVDHRLCDGAGTKLLAARLIDRYRRLAAGLPLPPRREEPGPRTLAALTGRSPPDGTGAPGAPAQPTHALPQGGFANERPAHAIRVIDAATLAALRAAARPAGATLTDAMLVALVRALQPFSLAPPGGQAVVMVTTDVRHRLPAGTPELLGNFFQGHHPELRCNPAEPFASALAAGAEAMGRVRAALTIEDALRDDAELERFQRLVGAAPELHLARLRERTATAVVLSNVGRLEAAPFELGTPPLLDTQLLGTVALGRELLLCASSFRGALTLSIGSCASDLDPAVVAGILDRIVAQLTGFAAS